MPATFPLRLQRRRVLSALTFVVCALAATAAAFACSVPVFRYALERWPSDPYRAVVFHRGQLDDETKRLAGELLLRSREQGGLANIDVHVVDVERPLDPEWLEIWSRHESEAASKLVIAYPAAARLADDVWSVSPSDVAAANLLDSPLRQEVGRRLVAGETAVWVLLESGDAKKDNAAASMLQRELARLHDELELPELAAEDEAILGEEGPELKINFSMLRLSRDDPAEQVTVAMLMGSENDLAEYADEPMVFAVFGQGRAYYALVGGGIEPGNIEQVGAFLVGECSCEVKAQNPGTDLLLSVNWGNVLGELVHDETLPPLMGVPAELASSTAPVSDEAGAAADAQSPASAQLSSAAAQQQQQQQQQPTALEFEYTALGWRPALAVAAALAFGLLAVVVASLWMIRKPHRQTSVAP